MTKHTPGPWEAHQQDRVLTGPHRERLIAALPELLAALEEMLLRDTFSCTCDEDASGCRWHAITRRAEILLVSIKGAK